MRALFTHPPDHPDAGLSPRASWTVPRAQLVERLREYNREIGASDATLTSIDALADSRAMCVVTGQQAGFMGGPLYAAYKIASAIVLARSLSSRLSIPVLPVFWLASEDHDFGEINHAHFMREDGGVGKVSFSWSGQGRSVSDLPVTGSVRSAALRYLRPLQADLRGRHIAQLFDPGNYDSYCRWCASIWARVFAPFGLIIVEPRIIRGIAGEFFAAAVDRGKQIREVLESATRAVEAAEYVPALDAATAGTLFGYNAGGIRTRDTPEKDLPRIARNHPELLSTDAALRPVLQDWVFPTLASVLGPGEIAYHAMLRGVYDVFGVPQPVLVPRHSITVVDPETQALAQRAGVDISRLLSEEPDLSVLLRELTDPDILNSFELARSRIREACGPLRDVASQIDPNLSISHTKTLSVAERGLDIFEARVVRAALAKRGISGAGLAHARSMLRPRGSWQERVFPLPFLMHRAGPDVMDRVLAEMDPSATVHHVLGI